MSSNHIPHTHQHQWISVDILLILLFTALILLYLYAVIRSNRHYKPWPIFRAVLWVFAVISAAVSLIGPLADRAHEHFPAHMLTHLLLGMLTPLLMVGAAPLTLFLRAISVSLARRVTRMMKTRFVRLYTNPIFTSLLNIGGLWLLYTTDLYSQMHHNALLYAFIHIHIFLAGYLYTLSFISLELPRKTSFLYRASVLLVSFAGHSILSKYIYSNSLTGVPAEEAELGSMIMYYGGDIIDGVLIFVFCLQWYRVAKPRKYQYASYDLVKG
ncbi:cytochrome c oxidase assembly protein [Fictibacillus phosphorivorans]|nr:cytochrome c oxidase assembly protein [Fictibacillus phosphorivorans]MCM3777177.1 cytochrome c oxidase assembly protein [Fictibacillus phosphorivorans]